MSFHFHALWLRWQSFDAQLRYERVLTLEAECRLDLEQIVQARISAGNALNAAKRRARAEELRTARAVW